MIRDSESSMIKRGNPFLITLFFLPLAPPRDVARDHAVRVSPPPPFPPDRRHHYVGHRGRRDAVHTFFLASKGRHLSQRDRQTMYGTDEMSLGKEESFYTTHSGEKGGKKVLSLHGIDEECIERMETKRGGVELTQECATPRGWACTTTSPRERERER